MSARPPAAGVAKARDLLARWAPDPVLFAREVLGIECWSRQRELLDHVARNPRVAWRSGHKVGKSLNLSILALWWVLTRSRAQVVLSATAGATIESTLWPTLRWVYDHAKVAIGGTISPDFHHGLKFADGRRVFGLKPEDSKAEAFAGIPGDLMYLIDEASGFPRPLIEAALGSVAAGGTTEKGEKLRECRIVLTGNPTRTSGPFYDCWHDDSGAWTTVHTDSRESPNITGRERPIPGLATREWLADWIDKVKGNEKDPIFQIRVVGNFPGQGADTIIDLDVVEAASARYGTTNAANDPLAIGVDVARFGDDATVICLRRGHKPLPLVSLQGQDGTAVAVRVLQLVRQHRKTGEVPRVKVDVIGVGASVYDALRLDVLQKDEVTYHPSKESVAVAVDVAEAAADAEHYTNRRAECWFAMRDWLAAGGSLPPDTALVGELIAPGYTFDGRGRYVVEPKDKIKDRIRRSPDRAEALMLSIVDTASSPIAVSDVHRLANIARTARPFRTRV